MTYDYLCTSCGHAWEAEQRISEDPLKQCPACKEMSAKRQISGGAGFILKGGGWYSDLYGSPRPASGGDKPTSGAQKSTSGGDSHASGAEKPANGSDKPAKASESSSSKPAATTSGPSGTSASATAAAASS
jgi:putative FmdB family regulatory protein